MNETARLALNAINRDFYRRNAASFSKTRAVAWPGWRRLDQHIRSPAPAVRLSVLDVGCGNGRFGWYLDDSLECGLRYVGIDSSAELLGDAKRALSGFSPLLLLEHDFVTAADQ